jgi:hypothetical protein
MGKEITIPWGPLEHGTGMWILDRWSRGDTIQTGRETAYAVASMWSTVHVAIVVEVFLSRGLQGEGSLAELAELANPLNLTTIDLDKDRELAESVGLIDLFDSTAHITQGLTVGTRLWDRDPTPLVPDITAAASDVGAPSNVTWGLTILGGAFGTVAGFMYDDVAEKVVEVAKQKAAMSAKTEAYANQLEDARIRGVPPPAPPEFIAPEAERERNRPWLWLMTGLGVGASAVIGAYFGLKAYTGPARRLSRAYAPRRKNPSAPRRLPPKRKTTTVTQIRAKQKTRTVRNPLRRGYSASVVSSNIAELKRAGYSTAQAAAIALRSGRTAWRRAQGKKAFPAHLQSSAKRRKNAVPKKRAPKKRATRKNPAPKKRAPKKKAPKKKAARKKTPRDAFIAKMTRKRPGKKKLTPKQAAGLWKCVGGKKRAKGGKCRPKARRGA